MLKILILRIMNSAHLMMRITVMIVRPAAIIHQMMVGIMMVTVSVMMVMTMMIMMVQLMM